MWAKLEVERCVFALHFVSARDCRLPTAESLLPWPQHANPLRNVNVCEAGHSRCLLLPLNGSNCLDFGPYCRTHRTHSAHSTHTPLTNLEYGQPGRILAWDPENDRTETHPGGSWLLLGTLFCSFSACLPF